MGKSEEAVGGAVRALYYRKTWAKKWISNHQGTYPVEYFECIRIGRPLLGDLEYLREIAAPKKALELEVVKCVLQRSRKVRCRKHGLGVALKDSEA